MKTKFETCWAILNGRILLPWAIRSTRRAAIDDIVEHCEARDWKEAKKLGYTVQKVYVEFSA